MHVRDWKLFLDGQWDKEIAIAQLSQELTDHLGAISRNVYLHQSYARKAVTKHGLSVEHLPLIFDVVDYGMALDDRPGHVTFLHLDETTWHEWFQVSVKCGVGDRRIFLVTFHRSNAAEVARKKRRHKTIRPAKT